MWRLLHIGFYISLAAFLVMGSVVVLAQLGGVVGFQPALVIMLDEVLGPPTFVMATLCGLFAFVLSYSPQHRDEMPEEE